MQTNDRQPVPRVGKASAHPDHPAYALLGIPHDDQQHAVGAMGVDPVFAALTAAWAVASAAVLGQPQYENTVCGRLRFTF